MIPIASPAELDALARTGAELMTLLRGAAELVGPGAATAQIDARFRAAAAAIGAEPQVPPPARDGGAFPGGLSVCVNEEAAGAPPGPRRLRPGDLVTLDAAIRWGGLCADASLALVVPGGDPGRSALHAALADAARRATRAVIDALVPGTAWSSAASRAHAVAEAAGFRVIETLSGHGIGRAVHQAPAAGFVRTFPDGRRPAGRLGPSAPQDFILRPGTVLTIEPVLTSGGGVTTALDDGWTVATADRAPACCEERSVAVTRRGPRILTP